MPRKYWKDSLYYKRILEILNDYWLTEEEEFRVRVQMDFIKANGETQSKCITWQNPNYTCETQPKTLEDCIISLSDLMGMSDYELYKREEEKFFSTGKIFKEDKND